MNYGTLSTYLVYVSYLPFLADLKSVHLRQLEIALTQLADSAKMLEVLEEHSFQRVVGDANAKLSEQIGAASAFYALFNVT